MTTAENFPRVHFGADERMLDEMTDRGYCSFASVELEDGTIHSICCWDLCRLRQDFEEEIKQGNAFFAQQGMVILESVTRENIETAARELARQGFFRKNS